MALLDHKQRRSGADSLGLFAATLAPLLYGGLLATSQLDVTTHPALAIGSLGQDAGSLAELPALLGKLLSLLPIGPLPLRVALGSVVAMAACSHLLYRCIELLLRTLGVTHEALIAPLALGLCLFVFGMPAVQHAALVPGAVALQAALSLWFLLQLSKLEASWPSYDLRPLGMAALALGLALANDVRAALVLLPAAVPTVSRVLHTRGPSPMLRALACLLLGALGVHAALALRGTLLPDALSHMRVLPAGSLSDALTLVSHTGHALSWFAVLVALGAVAALQTAGVRRIAMIWVQACLAPMLAYGLLAPTPSASDDLGLVTYVLPAAAVLAAALPGALLSPDGRSKPAPTRAQLGAVLCLLLIGAVRAHDTALARTAVDDALADTLSARGRHALPPRGLLLVRAPAHALPLIASEAEDHVRPDLLVVPMAALDDARSMERWLTRAPELRPLLRNYLLEGEIAGAELESLSGQRPVLLDLDPDWPTELHDALLPQHLFFEVSTATTRRAEQRTRTREALEDLQALAATGPSPLVRLHAEAAALYFTTLGDTEAAAEASASLTKAP
jgi:hypothetical protein